MGYECRLRRASGASAYLANLEEELPLDFPHLFCGASVSAVIAKLIQEYGFSALIITIPTIAVIFLTYRTYSKNIEASATQAEQAQRQVEELSRYIAQQERIREQLFQMEKLSALGELASGIAHDFNNTLAGILGRA